MIVEGMKQWPRRGQQGERQRSRGGEGIQSRQRAKGTADSRQQFEVEQLQGQVLQSDKLQSVEAVVRGAKERGTDKGA